MCVADRVCGSPGAVGFSIRFGGVFYPLVIHVLRVLHTYYVVSQTLSILVYISYVLVCISPGTVIHT